MYTDHPWHRVPYDKCAFGDLTQAMAESPKPQLPFAENIQRFEVVALHDLLRNFFHFARARFKGIGLPPG